MIIPMDTYTTNSTEFPFSLWLYQKYFDIERIGWGLYPTHNWTDTTPGHNAEHNAASAAFVASRMDAFEAYRSATPTVLFSP